MSGLKVLAEPLPNIPWEERPAGHPDVLWRYSANPVVPGRAIKASTYIHNSAVAPFQGAFAGVFRIQNVPAESMQPLVMIECPRLLFPFAREIIATATRNGGFPPLLLDPIDFVALYQQRIAQMQAQQPPTPPAA